MKTIKALMITLFLGMAGLVAADSPTPTATPYTHLVGPMTLSLNTIGGVKYLKTSYSVTGESSNLGNNIYWYPTPFAVGATYTAKIAALPYGVAIPYSAQLNVNSYPAGSQVNIRMSYNGGPNGTVTAIASYVLPAATSTVTPVASITRTPVKTATMTPTPTPAATATFVAGSHFVNDVLAVVTPAASQSQAFTLSYVPGGQVGIQILDVTGGRWFSTSNIPYVSSAILVSAAEGSPKNMAYTLSGTTLTVRFGSRIVFLSGHVYALYASYTTIVP